jgi:hypothetical protein
MYFTIIYLTALLVSPFWREWGQFRLVKVKMGIGIQKGILLKFKFEIRCDKITMKKACERRKK